jgi:MerR family transcriptional regulator, thiopeptide resistance regulator
MDTGEPVDGSRIGEIAAATGLTVRTLHHYEAVGLVRPTGRTAAGHRLYGPEALERLYRVSMLRSLGLSLAQIRESLDGGSSQLREVLAEHVHMVDERVDRQQRVRARLAALVGRLEREDDASADLLAILEDMAMLQPALDRQISILVYADLEAAYHYLVRVFALHPGELTRAGDGTVVHGMVHAGNGEVWLHTESEQFGLASPQRLGAATATMAVLVDDVDEHHRHAVGEGAIIRYPPIDQPYGFREYSAIDLEGHLWAFMRAHR